ncbi:MAG TPA: DNA-binding protein WhiA [Firmicutes bacterium]|nr:DNA-binding protein WhiA [Bacillota bacterium]
MDFYSLMKDELVRAVPERECCRVAELSALVKADGAIQISEGRVCIAVSQSHAGVARKVVSLLREVHRPALERPAVEVAVRKSKGAPRGNVYVIRVVNHDEAVELLDRLGLAGRNGLALGVEPRVVARRCCKRAYIRGAFLGAGYMGDPSRGYHLEIAVLGRQHVQDICSLLGEFGIRSGVVPRRGRSVVYLKDGDDIVELLRVMQASSALLELENTRIVRSIRGDVNRLVNAENANLGKIVDASFNQIRDIQLIDDMMGIRRLPQALAEVARLRLERPEASLAELGAMLSPSVSKSGVNHRMRRIARIADDIRLNDRR